MFDTTVVQGHRGTQIHWAPEEDASQRYYHRATTAKPRISSNKDWISCRTCLSFMVRDGRLPKSVLSEAEQSKRRGEARYRPV